jgi:hypothetical protein
VREAVHERAHEAQPSHASLELVSSPLRIGHRQSGEAGEARGVPEDRSVQLIVAFPRQAAGVFGVCILHAGLPMREHRQLDAGRVHRGDPVAAEIVEAVSAREPAHEPDLLRRVAIANGRRPKVFFYCDQSHRRAPERKRITVPQGIVIVARGIPFDREPVTAALLAAEARLTC